LLPSSAYRVLVARPLLEQLRAAPPALRGMVAGVVAVLRIDPLAPTFAFDVRPLGDIYRMAIVPGGRASLGFSVLPDRGVIMLLQLLTA
jgi:hypothetical protein